MCTYLKSPFILKREGGRERNTHTQRERESCLLSPCDMDRFVLWGLLLNINVCGCDRSRVFHPTEDTQIKSGMTHSFTAVNNKEQRLDHTHLHKYCEVSVVVKTERRTRICNWIGPNIAHERSSSRGGVLTWSDCFHSTL